MEDEKLQFRHVMLYELPSKRQKYDTHKKKIFRSFIWILLQLVGGGAYVVLQI